MPFLGRATRCERRLCAIDPGGPWLPAILTDERAECCYGQPVAVVDGEDHARGPGEVETVRVSSAVDGEAVDAAAAAGFHVVGVPAAKRGGEQEPTR